MSQKEDTIKELVIDFVSGECDTEQEKTVRAWIRKSEEHRQYYFETKMAWNRSIGRQNPYNIDPETGWNKLNNRLGSKLKINLNRLVKIAAVIAISFSCGFFTYWILQKKWYTDNSIVYHEVIAPYGSRTQLTLGDGSHVWLNAGSVLKYPSVFSGDFREVSLEGEAFFDIFTDKSNPFVVHVNNLKVKAYGTKFNVKAYPEEDIVETTLVEGVISLNIDSEDEVFLKKNQKAYVYAESNSIKLKNTDKNNDEEHPHLQTKKTQIIKELEKKPLYIEKNIATELSTSWKEGEWIFKETTIEDMAKMLERRYNVSFRFRTKETGYLEFSGTLRDETLEMLLDALSLIAPIKYEMGGRQVEIYEDPERKPEYLKHIENN